MNKHYNTIVLSPHLDDAALSCGGLIFEHTQQGKTVLVVTFMAGHPPQKPFSEFAQQMHSRWELAAQIVQERRDEDKISNHILGADYYHCDIPDAIYRDDPNDGNYFYTSDETLFGHVAAGDSKQTIPQIRQILSDLPTYEQLLVPLTVGNHVDHQLVRTAVEQQTTHSLLYYEDYPYARTSGAVESVIANDRLNWEYQTVTLSEMALKSKGESIAAFKSQMSTFFNGRAHIDVEIQAYASKVGGERYWVQKSP